MKLIYVLHFYQPDFQFKEVLEEVYEKSYKNIFRIIENSPKARIVVNVPASTIEQYNRYGMYQFKDDLTRLHQQGKIEILTTSLSHTLLSHTTKHQAERQVLLHNEKIAYYLNFANNEPKVLFPPELSVNSKVLKLTKNLNLAGMLVSHSSIQGYSEEENLLNVLGVKTFVRSLKVSRILESLFVKTLADFTNEIKKESINPDGFYIAAHDAEIIGHHYPEKVELFEELINSDSVNLTFFKDVLTDKNYKFKTYRKRLTPATWENVTMNGKKIDLHWKNPENKIHIYQWKLSELVVKKIEKYQKDLPMTDLQTYLDYYQYSCQYWWASSFPFWSPGIVSHAAWSWLYLAYKAYYALKPVNSSQAEKLIKEARRYYMKIIQTLAEYDITRWNEENIRYYDNNIHPLKLAYKL